MARHATGACDCFCLGHQFRGDPAGAGCAAAAVPGHLALCAGVAAGLSVFCRGPKLRGPIWRSMACASACCSSAALFIAMNGHISPGLASLVLQMQVFFTIGLSMLRTGEKLKAHQLLACALALAGMGVIAAHNGHGTTLAGLSLVPVVGIRLGAGQPGQPRSRQGQHAGLCGVGRAVLHAVASGPVASCWRDPPRSWPALPAPAP